MNSEPWLTAAVSDDSLVAELLLHLKDSVTATSADSFSGKIPVLPSWGLRQPRSSEKKRKRDAQRRSPTTPLSWTHCYEYDDSSAHLPHPSDLSRSKISASIESLITSSKRHSGKKEPATLRFTVVEQRLMNDSLKRRKLYFPLESGTYTEENSKTNVDRNMNETGTSKAATSSNASRRVKQEETSEEPKPSQQRDAVASQKPVFALPDLNMSPEEEESIVGMS